MAKAPAHQKSRGQSVRIALRDVRLSELSTSGGDHLRKCFRPVPGAHPSLDELRYDIANMSSLLKIELPAQSSAFFAVPHVHGLPSAPSTVDIAFEFNPSDYPSPATSDATSMFVELNPVRLFDMARSCDAEILASLVISSPSLADLSPASDHSSAPPLHQSDPKKLSRNLLKRLCH
ncbi:hypothetical protein C8R44DRAFT_873331 [Mycena epipterygia]|nr:hypothetical protein C8R44DRAFT_873331 [Mycena epipterygia]